MSREVRCSESFWFPPAFEGRVDGCKSVFPNRRLFEGRTSFIEEVRQMRGMSLKMMPGTSGATPRLA